MAERIAGYRGEFLWELDIAERQLVALAESIPQAMYDWRPAPAARSIAEVFVHIATGSYMLLDSIGIAPPVDLYSDVPAYGEGRFKEFLRRNDELVATVREKEQVVQLLKRSIDAVRDSFARSSESDLEQSLQFFREQTTVRRAYLRMLTHMHEHMGQLIAYVRVNGAGVPWPDWRPDRRSGTK